MPGALPRDTRTAPRVPVIGLTGWLGAGKTTLLNHLLTVPGARIGVIVNDFGAINVDAGLVTGQIDEAASIAGGCVCCLPDAGGLDTALERLTHPRLRLDAVIVEASGAADPLTLARLIRYSGAERTRPGGMVDVIDAAAWHDRADASAPDTGALAPARFAATSLVILNKLDRIRPAERAGAERMLTALIRERNPIAPVLAADHARIDPSLVFDVAEQDDPADQLPLSALLRPEHPAGHVHASAATVRARHPVDAGALTDLLEHPPSGAYRIKGCVPVRSARGARRHLVNLVGRSIHIVPAPGHAPAGDDGLVAIGMHLDETSAAERLRIALAPADSPDPAGLRRLHRYRRLSE